MRALLVAAVFVPVSALIAQGVVSPPGSRTKQGNWYFSELFRGGYTLQQIHTDLRGKALTIRQLALRQNRGDALSTARTVEADVHIGDSDWARRGRSFGQNFKGPAFVAMKKKKVNLPDWTKPPKNGFPAPFTAVFKFDAPWRYRGTDDLTWMIRVYSATASGRYWLDAASSTSVNKSWPRPYGLGCVPTGGRSPMSLTGTTYTYGSTSNNDHELTWSVRSAVPYARSTLMLGASNPNRLIPTLCTYQYVDNIFFGYNVFADSRGGFGTPTFKIPYDPFLVGFKFYCQAWSLDSGRHPGLLPVTASNGLEIVIPEQPPAPFTISYLYANSPFTTSGTLVDWKALVIEIG